MNNLEKTDEKDLIMKRKGEVRYLKWQEKNCKKEFALTIRNVQLSSEKYIYLEWTEGRVDNSKECTATEGKSSASVDTKPHCIL